MHEHSARLQPRARTPHTAADTIIVQVAAGTHQRGEGATLLRLCAMAAQAPTPAGRTRRDVGARDRADHRRGAHGATPAQQRVPPPTHTTTTSAHMCTPHAQHGRGGVRLLHELHNSLHAHIRDKRTCGGPALQLPHTWPHRPAVVSLPRGRRALGALARISSSVLVASLWVALELRVVGARRRAHSPHCSPPRLQLAARDGEPRARLCA